jgi:hypothetical protein
MNATNERETANDAEALLETLQMRTKQRDCGVGGTWVRGTIGGHRFDALVFPDHADHPDYELGNSRISKLWVRRNSDRQVVAYFERGWDLRPTTPVAEQIVELLAAGLATAVFAS